MTSIPVMAGEPLDTTIIDSLRTGKIRSNIRKITCNALHFKWLDWESKFYP